MNTQIPQIKRRKIGAVTILDIKGELVGPWALRAKEDIASLMKIGPTKNLLINLKELDTVDSLGVKAVAENLNETLRSGIIRGKLFVMEMFARTEALNRIKVFHDEDEVIEYFGKEFVSGPADHGSEKREYDRLKTAIPLEFWYEAHGERIAFKAIVTDLSQGGLFAEYLDLETVDTIHKDLDPYGLKRVDLKMKLPGYEYVEGIGKVLRTVIADEQLGLGIQFEKLRKGDAEKISEYLK